MFFCKGRHLFLNNQLKMYVASLISKTKAFCTFYVCQKPLMSSLGFITDSRIEVEANVSGVSRNKFCQDAWATRETLNILHTQTMERT